ncbi:hypothetical protein CCR85_10310 [Rhodothalassium salexigens]|uniref:retropepsin-like aspartic protease family protein n=1 Tax=Rhodothalassium salexigens TaxID=1086 RepID=UPI001914A1F5|nr:TIGR02281 family clan AA aspartic protease [Rhodothalassium salexigens]MBK5911881.1 hypothetical protein [Rhodothalassium salexigens]
MTDRDKRSRHGVPEDGPAPARPPAGDENRQRARNASDDRAPEAGADRRPRTGWSSAPRHTDRHTGRGLGRRGMPRWLVPLALVGLGAWLLTGPLAGASLGVRVFVLAWGGFAVLMASRFFAGRPLGAFARPALVWLAIVAVLAGGYAFRRELGAVGDRVSANLGTGQGYSIDAGPDRARAFERAADGHFYVRATVGGTPLRFMVDTGASLVVLSPADARRIGIDPPRAAFTGRVQTANGTVAVAPVRLDAVRVGDIVVRDVPALVHGRALGQSLLGQSFLNALDGYEVRDGRLILKQAATR